MFGHSLIIQFLYHANMTEQVYANPTVVQQQQQAAGSLAIGNATNTTNKSSNEINLLSNLNSNLNANQPEYKCKRIKILRVLAIKTACLLNWNLINFEKE